MNTRETINKFRNFSKKKPSYKKQRREETNVESQQGQKVAAKNQKKQQPKAKASTTPKKSTKWFKKEESRKKPHTPEKIPGKILMKNQKRGTTKQQNFWRQPVFHKSQHTGNTSTRKLNDVRDRQQYKRQPKDCCSIKRRFAIYAKITRKPPIDTHLENPEHHLNFQSHKSTPKIDMAVLKTNAINENWKRQANPKLCGKIKKQS